AHTMPSRLSPAQQAAFDALLRGLPLGNVFVLWGAVGSGKTTVLGEVQAAASGTRITIKDFHDALQPRHPLALEETFAQLVLSALAKNDCVLVDDLDLLWSVTAGGCGMYPRAGWLEAPMMLLGTYAIEAKKKLILAGGHSAAVRQRAYQFGIGDFKPAGYAHFFPTPLPAAPTRPPIPKTH